MDFPLLYSRNKITKMKSCFSHIHCSPPKFSISAANSITPPRRCSSSSTTSSNLRFSSFMLNLQRSITFASLPSSCRCRATSAGPPSPPQTEPPYNEENSSPSPGNADGQDAPGLSDNLGKSDDWACIMASFSKAQDTTRIFFAVLFWMSLFFWYSVWDGKNDGRPNKGSRFRR